MVFEVPLGQVLVAETRKGLVYVGLGPQSLANLTTWARQWQPDAQIVPSIVDSFVQLDEYFQGNRQKFDLPLDLWGTDFQQRVWQALLEIPFGETRSYGQISGVAGYPKAARAVGQACGANPIPIVVPCHRVLQGTGKLGGYSSGHHWKEWLLNQEKSAGA
ncbi:MAG: methylated-DNA--[protein]-cysteine S-methyltransferase, partial [Deltaproteobacteria bacterium]|nr:methylated-DNA--[protein]-cysteine S-methyltransferase [Deltaproteobacteria bacterium]